MAGIDHARSPNIMINEYKYLIFKLLFFKLTSV